MSFPGRRSRGGFALLITITLLAFLVILLVSLASLTRVETQVAANTQQLAQARQNALLGLGIALGRLQQLAGPDQRVTGTADLVSSRDVSKKNWTGVWDGAFTIDPAAASFQTPRGWLVSGAAATGASGVTTPLSAASGNTLIPLVGEGSTDTSVTGASVSVESEPIKTTGVPGLPDNGSGHVIGNFAYWVGDEGVKAKVNLVDPWINDADASRRLYSFISAQRNGIERVETQAGSPSSPAPLGTNYPVNDPHLSSVLSLAQFPFAQSAVAAQTTLRTTARNRFHDLTTVSFSVLSDTARGGLKRDLTNWLHHPGASGSPTDTTLIYDPGAGNDPYGLPRWGLIRSYDGIRNEGAPVTPRAMVSDSASTQQGLYPIVTYFRLGTNISCAGPGSPLIVHVFPLLVLWNPYNVDIAATPYEVCYYLSDSAAQMRWRVGNATGRVLALLNYNRTSLDSAGSARHWRFSVAPTVIPAGKSLVFSLGATEAYQAGHNQLVHAADNGESVTFTSALAAPGAAELGVNIFWDRDTWAGGTMFISLRTAPANTNLDVTGIGIPDGSLQSMQLIGYGSPGNSTYTVPTDRPATADHYIPVPVAPLQQLRTFAGMASGGGIKARWIAQQNLRAPLVLRPRVDGNVNSAYFGDLEKTGAQPSFDGAFASAGVSVTGATANDFILAEFQPANVPLFSLAQLQHACLSETHLYPAYAIGNSIADPHVNLDQTIGSPDAGGAHVGGVSGNIQALYDISYLLNRELWDRYFFSTVPDTFDASNLADTAYHLPSARHAILRETNTPLLSELNGPDAFQRSSARLVVDGGFNINSTSYEAWRALLASHNNVATDGAKTHSLSRFTKPVGSPNQVWAGHRILSDAQINRLAWNIVSEVKRRGPFLSLADFVNRRLLNDAARIDGYKGALQAAIDTGDTETASPPPTEPAIARINDDTAFTGNLVDSPTSGVTAVYDDKRFQGGPVKQAPYSSRLAFAPGYLTQADLLNVLGPVLTARSDTFRIRAYGDVKNPATGVTEGMAWCEAIVQRSPGYVETNVSPWDMPVSGSDSEKLGRRFVIVSFRWLSRSDL